LTENTESKTHDRPILLTGGTGFVGTNTVHHLIQQGHRVRCLVRPTSDVSRLPGEVQAVEGHLLNFESLRRAVDGCWGVIHIGGVVSARQVRDYYQVNRDGTANLVKAAREAGVKRFLLCSSQAAAGPSTPDRRRRCDDPPAPVTDYGRSKLEGEEVLADGAGEMWWCIIRPPAIYGPWDKAFLPLVRWIIRGFKPRLGDGRMPFALIHAVDLARAVTLSIEADHPSGAIWFATDGADHNTEELAAAVEAAVGKKARWITVPTLVAPLIGQVIELVARIHSATALLGRQKLIELTRPAWTCDDTPLREATGYKELFDLTHGMAQTVEWYQQRGWI